MIEEDCNPSMLASTHCTSTHIDYNLIRAREYASHDEEGFDSFVLVEYDIAQTRTIITAPHCGAWCFSRLVSVSLAPSAAV